LEESSQAIDGVGPAQDVISSRVRRGSSSAVKVDS